MGFLYGIFLLSILIQIYRYFSVYTFTERQKAKWVFFGIIGWIAASVVPSIPYYYVMYLPPGQPTPIWFSLLSPVWFLSLSILPVSISIAILRSHMWDIDVVIRKTLVYSLLSGLLGLVYFGSVTLIQDFVTADRNEPPAFLIVITTLIIAALFSPLRKRLQNMIDRRFYRRKYDAEKALSEFTAAARSETDLSQLASQLTGTVQETMQPVQVELWLQRSTTMMPGRHSERTADGPVRQNP
jgi:hypothetical protein